jgi:hypothetical protein
VKENKNRVNWQRRARKKSTGNEWVHNSIFYKKNMRNGGDELFFTLPFLFCELTNSMFCQTKNTKLLEFHSHQQNT